MRLTFHACAALCLIAFAAVKFAAILHGLPVLSLHNTVFPFFQNLTIYVMAVAAEVVAAIVCLKYRGRIGADYCLWFFIGLILWYRLGVYATGGTGYGCACLGILSVLFKLTKAQEDMISISALLFLVGCTSPGLLAHVRHWLKPAHIVRLLLLVIGFVPLSAHGETVQIDGYYTFNAHNAETGAAFPATVDGVTQAGRYKFVALVSGEKWRISVTNVTDATIWSNLLYDGTNLIAQVPHSPPFFLPKDSRADATFVTVSDSQYFLPSVSDWAHASIPWLTFGMNPSRIKNYRSEGVEIPLPWETSRRKPLAFGWLWKITPSTDSRFIASCEIVREIDFDLNQRSELLRFEMNYPENIAAKNRYITSLDYRRNIPDGFVETFYKVTEWHDEAGRHFPMRASVVRNLSGYRHPCFRAELVAETFRTFPADLVTLDPPSVTSLVEDYRYKRANRAKIFKFASYTLSPGDPWRSGNDPILLKEAENHLKYGPRYNSYDYSYKQFSVWVLGILLLIFFPTLIWMRKR